MKTILDGFKDSNESWYSEYLGSCNASSVNFRIMNNKEAKFHVHENQEEMFIVISGTLFIDFDDEMIQLEAGDSYTVKSGVKHRARAIGKVKLLVIGGT